MIKRCDWVKEGIHQNYHDIEWGVPLHNDQKLFELLLLGGAQAGLSWMTILKRREGYRNVFDGFDPEKIGCYKKTDINRILKDVRIIRNRKKVEAFVNNAKCFLKVREKFETFDSYLWRFVDFKTIVNYHKTWHDIPSTSDESSEMSACLKKDGFTFVGPTICYAFMQSVGMVNDHIISCFRHKDVSKEHVSNLRNMSKTEKN
jgi:DNA-3-methyladenine glycosylase I